MLYASHPSTVGKDDVKISTIIKRLASTMMCMSLFAVGLFMTACSDEGGNPTSASNPSTPGTSPATTGGVAAAGPISLTLAWSPSPDPSVTGYYVHYGPNSSDSPGSCNYAQSLFVNSPEATIPDLDRGRDYFFAVSSFNGEEGPCSYEVKGVTPV